MPSPLGWAVPRPVTGFSVDDAPVADRVGSVLMAAQQMPQTGNAQLAGELETDGERRRRLRALSRGAVTSWVVADVVPSTQSSRSQFPDAAIGSHSTAVGRRTRWNERTRRRDGGETGRTVVEGARERTREAA